MQQIQILKTQEVPIQDEQGIVKIRRLAREWGMELSLNKVAQTKLMTAASELARNIIRYAGTGVAQINLINNGNNSGVQIVFSDQGPGIADVELALKDGYSTGKSLGMGLGGTKRLVDEFAIVSSLGKGTCVTVVIWK